MQNKKTVLRTCVVSKETCEKKDLIRIVRDKEGVVSVDLKGKANGRGAYLKKDVTVVEKAKKTKVLERHLEVAIPDEIYEELINIING